MRLLSLLEDERKSSAIWYVLFRQSPKLFVVLTLGRRDLFRHLLVAFLAIGAVGIAARLRYDDLGAAAA